MITVVTASTDVERARDCIESWRENAREAMQLVVVSNGPEKQLSRPIAIDIWLHHEPYLGTVPAYDVGVTFALDLAERPEIIACLHDDFLIDEPGWDTKVRRHFERNPACGLLGFGGAVGLGSDRLYKDPYDPMQLARIGFRSNLDDAELHGTRSLLTEQVACLDGFSQIGTWLFWEGYQKRGAEGGAIRYKVEDRPWTMLNRLGMVHHFYDGALGCLAKRYNWETWYLPLRGHHFGGRTAVGDQGYGDWANGQIDGGDQGFWSKAHTLGYREFQAELPLRI